MRKKRLLLLKNDLKKKLIETNNNNELENITISTKTILHEQKNYYSDKLSLPDQKYLNILSSDLPEKFLADDEMF